MSQTGEVVLLWSSRVSNTCYPNCATYVLTRVRNAFDKRHAWQLWQPELLAQSIDHIPSCLCLFGQTTLDAKAFIRECVTCRSIFNKSHLDSILKQRPLLWKEPGPALLVDCYLLPCLIHSNINWILWIVHTTDKAIKHCRCSSNRKKCCFFYSTLNTVTH